MRISISGASLTCRRTRATAAPCKSSCFGNDDLSRSCETWFKASGTYPQYNEDPVSQADNKWITHVTSAYNICSWCLYCDSRRHFFFVCVTDQNLLNAFFSGALKPEILWHKVSLCLSLRSFSVLIRIKVGSKQTSILCKLHVTGRWTRENGNLYPSRCH